MEDPTPPHMQTYPMGNFVTCMVQSGMVRVINESCLLKKTRKMDLFRKTVPSKNSIAHKHKKELEFLAKNGLRQVSVYRVSQKKKLTVGKYSLNERAGKICENFQFA